ncbi:response regulator [Candidatus Chloroploca asiatica]|uniref:DNA-binding response regulator n=1 Tax=Candidatus Chloroploca asiatica TaxID=1506545 RepID=A0A2H3KI94_9CHLR|nr:response regulator transcription factor [Candidatus Chloroploca asiatica]PDV97533.1 DNA-binding response regulator [Candidatus Chloroploca asiatica]
MASHIAIKLLVVDDHPLFRQGVRWALSGEDDIVIVGDVASGEAALEWLAQADSHTEPNVMLVDMNLPGMNGLALTRHVRRQYPGLGVVMLSMHESDEQAFHALQSGAAAYRSKDVKPQALIEILRRVAHGEYVINDVLLEEPRVASRVLTQFRSLPEALPTDPEAVDVPIFTPLSDREIEVLERIAAGGSNKEIADSLHISTQTVKNHISSILRKLSLNDRTQAVLFALRRGWIETPQDIRQGPLEPPADASQAQT